MRHSPRVGSASEGAEPLKHAAPTTTTVAITSQPADMNKGSLLAFGHLRSQGLATMLHAAATAPHPLNRPNMPLPALSADAGAARNGENLLATAN